MGRHFPWNHGLNRKRNGKSLHDDWTIKSIANFANRRYRIEASGEELLFYPQMTLMTQIFLGCAVRGKPTTPVH